MDGTNDFNLQNLAAEVKTPKIGKEQLLNFMRILEKYKSGKHRLEARVIESEEWWKLHNNQIARVKDGIEQPGELRNASGWLHNVLVSKHADAIEAYPEPNILPREQGDKEEAKRLSSILPCILEQNHFEEVYDEAQWQKLKTGTCVYSVVWDAGKLNGLGDISIGTVSLLNIFWEPGIKDIQESLYVFTTKLVDNAILKEKYPQYADKFEAQGDFVPAKFLYDDRVDTTDKSTVIEVYYHTTNGEGKRVLQYCQFVNDIVLYATENDTEQPTKPQTAVNPETGAAEVIQVPSGLPASERGIYDHAQFPFVFDVLFPIEGSPCGYGYVDLCKGAQEQIDTMGKAMVDNAVANSTPRYLSKQGGGINEAEFMDLRKPIVHYSGTGADILPINTTALQGNSLNYYNAKIEELRQVSGNTESATGQATAGVTAASAIAALQEASGKGSRASTLSAYRAFGRINELQIELIRQFYDMPRTFRIIGQRGAEEYISYTNAQLQAQYQGSIGDIDLGFRLPVFDIKVSAQKKNVYTKVAQNELALQFFQLGFFNPQLSDQALACIEMMDFDDKDKISQMIAQNGTMYQQLLLYQQLALSLAQASGRTDIVQGLASQITGQPVEAFTESGEKAANLSQSDNISGIESEEHTRVKAAREQSNKASQPEE